MNQHDRQSRLRVLVVAAVTLSSLPSVNSWMTPTRRSVPAPHRTFLSSTLQINTLDGVDIRGPLSCVANHMVVKVRDTLTATGGGILLPDQSQTRPTEGYVVVAGPGRRHPHSGVLIPNPIAPGMSVVYGKFDGKPVEYNGDECQIIRDDNVLLAYTGVTVRLDTAVLLGDYVLIAMFDDSESSDGSDSSNSSNTIATSSGVVIAASVLKNDLPCQGRVVKVGPGRLGPDGVTHLPSPVQPGDYVKFKDYAGNDILMEGKPYSVVKMVDLLSTYTE